MENLFLTQKIKEIENLKADMLETFAKVSRKTALGAPTNDIARHLAQIVTDAYMLGDALGISFGALDVFAAENLKKSDAEGANGLYRHICRGQKKKDEVRAEVFSASHPNSRRDS